MRKIHTTCSYLIVSRIRHFIVPILFLVASLIAGDAFLHSSCLADFPILLPQQGHDLDGLENKPEIEIGTNPRSVDSDNDGLSDYEEYCKYHTDPTKSDSDNDGIQDGDWHERREYTYTIRAICEIRPPNKEVLMNDIYQDVRLTNTPSRFEDGAIVEVLLFPFATPHVFAQAYPYKSIPKRLQKYLQRTLAMNFSEEMREEVGEIVKDANTDIEAVESILAWITSETRLENSIPEFAYFNVVDNKIIWRKSLGSTEKDERLLHTNFFGDSMFKNRVHGTCSSTATLRSTMLRAAGIPTRIIQTLPLINRYEGDPEPLVDRMRKRIMARGYEWGADGGGANHVYNEVFLNNHWIRVDDVLNVGPFVGDKLFVKVYTIADWNDRLDWHNPRPPEDNWNQNRDFRTLEVSDAYPKYPIKCVEAIDLAIEDKNMAVTKLPNGCFQASISIQNKSNIPSPAFPVHFYIGHPRKGGRLLASHKAGPIMPRSVWNEGTHPFNLKKEENDIFIIIDPENVVKELDEKNNCASKTISSVITSSNPLLQLDTIPSDDKAKIKKLSSNNESIKEDENDLKLTSGYSNRYFVRLVIGDNSMTFEGQKITWEQLPEILSKIEDRQHTVL